MIQSLYKKCNLCPRNCNVNRVAGELGFCKCTNELSIASICKHFGEEPVLGGSNGVVNIFFQHCNLQCIYCQNAQISDNRSILNLKAFTTDSVVKAIDVYYQHGIRYVGFVTPTHYIPHIIDISSLLKEKYNDIKLIYNSNAYDNVDKLMLLEGLIDIYLPDFKYADDDLAMELSCVNNYKEVALKSIKEMVRQKGTSIIYDEEQLAESGVIVRHLILPNNVGNSIKVLELLADEVSFNLNISLMSQYNPTNITSLPKEINRKITMQEFIEVEKALAEFGFYRGWTQDLSSSDNYNPDFLKDDPFL